MNFFIPSFVLVPIAASCINYKALTKAFKLLCYYFLSSLLVNIITTVLAYYHVSNLFFFHLFTPVEAVFLLLFFKHVFTAPNITKIIQLLIIVFPTYCLVNFIFLQNSNVFNTYTHPLEAILFIALCVYYFFHKSKHEELEATWTSFPLNWVISGLLLYFSSAFFLYIFSNFLISNYSTQVNLYIWNIHGALIILMNLLCAIGFYKCKK
jgi:hypothetical protein